MKELPPIEKTPILMMRFTSKVTKDVIKLVKARLEEEGIIVFEEMDENQVIFGLTTRKRVFENEAERCKIFKPSKLVNVPDQLKNFEGSKFIRPFEVMNRFTFIRDDSEIDDYAVYDSERLFTSADRVKIVFSAVEGVTVLKVGSSSNGNQSDEYTNMARWQSSWKNAALVQVFNSTFQIREEEIADTYRNRTIVDCLKDTGSIDVFAAVHSSHIEDICHTAIDPRTPFPVDALRTYYGEEIAFYFAWLRFYTWSLFFPGISGLFIYLFRKLYSGETVDTCRLTPFHGLLTFLWAITFIQFWIRQEHGLSYEWGTSKLLPLSELEVAAFTIRHQFQGEMRKSEVTGQMEKYYPTNLRRMKYFGSALVTFVLLAGAFFVMIASLNMQGFIEKHEQVLAKDGSDYGEHPFYFPTFASLAEEGGLFDAKSAYFSYMPVISHVLMVSLMNTGYRKVAEKLTDWENHETQLSYNNSMIIKRFFFEAFDCYLVLFYLAFFEQDVEKVRSELVSVFHLDTFRRLLLEGAVPYVTQKINRKRKRAEIALSKKTDEPIKSDDANLSTLAENARKDHYDQFDDYIEMIIQLGYITLFASAYPLAPFVAIIANSIELRLDAAKLTYVTMRPRPMPYSDVGTWKVLIKIIVWMSAITNCFIFCFSSMQMYQYVPEYFTVDKDGEHDLKAGSGIVVIFMLFGIERLLIALGLLIDLFVPDLPEAVVLKEKKKQFVDFRLHQEMRAKKNREWEKKIKDLFSPEKFQSSNNLLSSETIKAAKNFCSFER